MKVPKVSPRSREGIEKEVKRLLYDTQPEALIRDDSPVDVESIFEFYIPDKFGVKTGYTDLSAIGPNILGYTDAISNTSYVDKSLSDSDNPVTIRRFRATVAHESSHSICHLAELKDFNSSLIETAGILYRELPSNIKPYENPEWQAWYYAGALLMPTARIFRYVERGYSANDMANIFDVNPVFVKVRLNKLGIKTNPS